MADSFFRDGERLSGEAEDLLASKASSGGFFASLFGGHSRSRRDALEEAAEKFAASGNAFKGGKYWREAAKAYSRGALSAQEASEPDEAARLYVLAGSSLKRICPEGTHKIY